MNLKEVKEIIQIVEDANIEELEIEREGMKIKVKKTASSQSGVQGIGAHMTVIPAPAQPSHISHPGPVAPEIKSEKPKETTEAKPEDKNFVSIVSPMVGTFYRASSPDASPYVEVGSLVKKNQVVCIVEAMKLMNEIESEFEGKIVKILVENGQAVEFGQALFQVEPA